MASSALETDVDVLISNAERHHRHSLSEASLHVPEIMATVTPPDQLTWTRTLAWSLNTKQQDGSQKINICTTWDQIAEFYGRLREEAILTKAGRPHIVDLPTRWYVLSEAESTPMRDVETGEAMLVDTAALFMMDGPEGIASEICWRKPSDENDVPLTPTQRTELWGAFQDALRRQDIGGLLDLMSPTVQGAVRDYFDADPPFVAIDGKDAMRAYYEKFFQRLEVVDITLVLSIIRDYYVFNELSWTARLRDSGREVKFLTAETMAFDAAGLFQGRCGYGTEME